MSTVLPLFGKLSSSNWEERLESSVELVRTAENFQQQFATPDLETLNDSNLDLDKCISSDVAYTLRRLTRGLASSRESSRQGFAVALTELLSHLDAVTVAQILALVDSASHISGTVSGQEERDLLMARLFGLTCIVQSELVYKVSTVRWSNSVPISSQDEFLSVISQLLSIGDKKTWIKESAWWSLCLAMVKLCKSQVEWKQSALTRSLDTLFVTHTTWSSEKIALVIKLRPICPDQPWVDLLQPTFKKGSVLADANLAALSSIICESPSASADTFVAAVDGPWRRPLHFVWQAIIDSYFPSEGDTNATSGKKSFMHFWREVVSGSLFSANSTSPRRYVGFQILRHCLSRVSDEQLPQLFTKSILQIWMSSLSDGDKHMHQISRSLADDIQSVANQRPAIVIPLVDCLLGANGSPRFDRVTRTKTVESLLTVAGGEGVARFVQSHLKDATRLLKNKEIEKDKFTAIVDQLESVLRNPSINKSTDVHESIIEFFTLHGWFDRGSIILPDELHSLCRSRLLVCLGDMCGQHHKGFPGDAETESVAEYSWIHKAVSMIDKSEQDSSLAQVVSIPTKGGKQCVSRARRLTKKAQQLSASRARVGQSLVLLLSAIRLQYIAEPEEDILAILEACCDTVENHLQTEGPAEADDSAASLVEVIISLLESESSYCRKVAVKAFELIQEIIDEASVDLLIAQLYTTEEDEDMEDEGEGGESPSEDGADNESESSLSDSASSLSDPLDGEEDLELRNKLREALGELDAESDDEESEEEELLDDDAMLAMDDKIAAAFKSQTRGGVKERDEERKALHFKNRILDLVDTYLKNQPTNPTVHGFILPMLTSMIEGGKESKEFTDKISSILRARFGKAKVVALAEVDSMKQNLTLLHELANKVTTADRLFTVSGCCLYVSRALVEKSQEEFVAETYTRSLKSYSEKKASPLNSAFFNDFRKRLPEAAWIMRETLLESDGAVNPYRKAQLLQIAGALLVQTDHRKNPKMAEASGAYISGLFSRICETVELACTVNISVKTPSSAQLKDIGQTAQKVAQHVRKTSPPNVQWDMGRLVQTETAIANSDRLKSSGIATIWKSLLASIRPMVKTEPSGLSDEGSGSKKPSKRKGDGEEAADPAEAEQGKSKRKKQRVGKEETRISKE